MSTTSDSNGSEDPSAGDELGAGSGTTARAGSGDRSSRTDQRKKILAIALVVHLVVATFTLRDLRRRPTAAVRGPKRLWRVWVTMNTTGSMAYWLFGRRDPVDQL